MTLEEKYTLSVSVFCSEPKNRWFLICNLHTPAGINTRGMSIRKEKNVFLLLSLQGHNITKKITDTLMLWRMISQTGPPIAVPHAWDIPAYAIQRMRSPM